VEYADQQGRRFALDTSYLPGSLGIAASLLTLKQVSFRSKLEVLKFLFLFRMGRIKADSLTCSELLLKYGQGEDIRRVFWEPLILATLNAPSHLASADIFIEVLRRAFFSSGRNASIYIPQVPLTRLLEPIEEWLSERNSILMKGTTVSGIVIENGSVVGVRTSPNEFISCDALIIAVPPEQLRKLMFSEFGDTYFKELDKYSFMPISSVYIWTDREISGSGFVALLDSPIHWIFNSRRISGKKGNADFPYLSTMTISSSEELTALSDEEFIRLGMAELGRAFPGSSGVKVLHYRIIHYKRATVRISPEISGNRMASTSSLPNMFFAGDWTATGLPATLEGASLSGEIAAAEAAKALGL
jgi:protoporphyrinogen oxidase